MAKNLDSTHHPEKRRTEGAKLCNRLVSSTIDVRSKLLLKSPAVQAQAIGAIVGVTFGCAWGIAGAWGLRTPWRTPTAIFSIVVSAVLVGLLATHNVSRQSGTFRGGVYGIAVTLETAGVLAVVWLLRRLGLPQFLMPAIGFIVGLHFLGLWQATDLMIFVWVSLAMCLVCGFAVFVPGNQETTQIITGLGSATVLWAAGIATLR